MNIYKLPDFYEPKKYGYKNIDSAKSTIKHLKNKKIFEKIQIIELMIKRAIRHPYRTPSMIQAVNYFNDYLKILKKKTRLSILPVEIVHFFLNLAKYYNISLIARKILKSSITDKTFLEIYPNIESQLKKKFIAKDKFVTWYNFRRNILFKKMKSPIDWFHKDGVLKGLPTKEHVVFILWGYSPYREQLKELYYNKKTKKTKKTKKK